MEIFFPFSTLFFQIFYKTHCSRSTFLISNPQTQHGMIKMVLKQGKANLSFEISIIMCLILVVQVSHVLTKDSCSLSPHELRLTSVSHRLPMCNKGNLRGPGVGCVFYWDSGYPSNHIMYKQNIAWILDGWEHFRQKEPLYWTCLTMVRVSFCESIFQNWHSVHQTVSVLQAASWIRLRPQLRHSRYPKPQIRLRPQFRHLCYPNHEPDPPGNKWSRGRAPWRVGGCTAVQLNSYSSPRIERLPELGGCVQYNWHCPMSSQAHQSEGCFCLYWSDTVQEWVMYQNNWLDLAKTDKVLGIETKT